MIGYPFDSSPGPQEKEEVALLREISKKLQQLLDIKEKKQRDKDRAAREWDLGFWGADF